MAEHSIQVLRLSPKWNLIFAQIWKGGVPEMIKWENTDLCFSTEINVVEKILGLVKNCVPKRIMSFVVDWYWEALRQYSEYCGKSGKVQGGLSEVDNKV